MFNNLVAPLRKYILIFLSVIILSLVLYSKSFSEENIFVVDKVVVVGTIDLNFSRDKYIDIAFLNSFKILMSRILLTKDMHKISNIKIKKIKSLVESFQILEESYRKDEYKSTFKINYNDVRVKKLLAKNNISFSQPKNISAIFFPVLFVNDEIKAFNENYFYNEWIKVKIENESINFILPLEDLDDIPKINEMKNNINELNVNDFVNKYDVKNYVFALMEHNNKQLNVHIKMDLDDNEMNKNISYELLNFEEESKLDLILKDLKMQITDIWKEANIVNLLMPLSIRVKFQYKNLLGVDKLKSVFNKISIIDDYTLEEFNTKNTYFKIYYYGNPKKLRTELTKFGYQLRNDQGYWELYRND